MSVGDVKKTARGGGVEKIFELSEADGRVLVWKIYSRTGCIFATPKHEKCEILNYLDEKEKKRS